MLLDQLLQGGAGAEQAPSAGSTAAPALTGDPAAGQESSGFSEALGLLTGGDASGDQVEPDGASLVPGELLPADAASSTIDDGTETAESVDLADLSGLVVQGAVLDAAVVATAAAALVSEPGLQGSTEAGEGGTATRPPIGGLASGATRVAAADTVLAGAPDVSGEPVGVGERASTGTTPGGRLLPEPSGPGAATEVRAATHAIAADPSVEDAGSSASSKSIGQDGATGRPAVGPSPTAASPTAAAPGLTTAEQQRGEVTSPGAPESSPPRAASVATAPPTSDAARPAPVALEGAPATRVASEQAAALVAAASRPAPRAAGGASQAADLEGSREGGVSATAVRADVAIAQSDGTGLVAGIGEETTATGSHRAATHAAIVAGSESLARVAGQRPPTQRTVATVPTASTGSAETGSAPLTQSAPAVSQASPTGVLARVDQPQGFSALAERIVDALHLSAVRGGSEIRLRVEPHGLGHIDVRVQLQDDGVRAMIVAEHESTRALISSNQHLLEAALGRSELRLSGFSVDLGLDQGGMDFHEAEQGGEQEAALGSSEHEAREREAVPGEDQSSAFLASGRLSLRV